MFVSYVCNMEQNFKKLKNDVLMKLNWNWVTWDKEMPILKIS